LKQREKAGHGQRRVATVIVSEVALRCVAAPGRMRWRPTDRPGAARALDAFPALAALCLRCCDLRGVLALHRRASWRCVRGIMLVIWISWVYWYH